MNVRSVYYTVCAWLERTLMGLHATEFGLRTITGATRSGSKQLSKQCPPSSHGSILLFSTLFLANLRGNAAGPVCIQQGLMTAMKKARKEVLRVGEIYFKIHRSTCPNVCACATETEGGDKE